jgi:hypothetical protein
LNSPECLAAHLPCHPPSGSAGTVLAAFDVAINAGLKDSYAKGDDGWLARLRAPDQRPPDRLGADIQAKDDRVCSGWRIAFSDHVQLLALSLAARYSRGVYLSDGYLYPQ